MRKPPAQKKRAIKSPFSPRQKASSFWPKALFSPAAKSAPISLASSCVAPPTPADERRHFLAQVGSTTPFYQLFDHMPDVAFFAKDRHFRLMCASQRFLERLGLQRESEVLGKDDFALFPRRLAESFRRDDEEILRTGEAKTNIVELFFTEQGIPDWFITTKLPLRGEMGEIIGLMGTVHGYAQRREILQPAFKLDQAVRYLREHFSRGVSVKELAHFVRLSPRQLHRKFVEAFGASPQAFILKLRIQAACEDLQKEQVQISDVAAAFGFCSQSAFTQVFVKHVGLTPRSYQQRYRLRRE